MNIIYKRNRFTDTENKLAVTSVWGGGTQGWGSWRYKLWGVR